MDQTGLYVISEAEMRLIRRVRQLPAGANLVILSTDGDGVISLTVLDSGRVEKLRKPNDAEQV